MKRKDAGDIPIDLQMSLQVGPDWGKQRFQTLLFCSLEFSDQVVWLEDILGGIECGTLQVVRVI